MSKSMLRRVQVQLAKRTKAQLLEIVARQQHRIEQLQRIPRLRIRAEETEKWLREQKACDPFTEQRHCDAGTRERVYWHHGYLMALRDALAYLEDRSKLAVESRRPT